MGIFIVIMIIIGISVCGYDKYKKYEKKKRYKRNLRKFVRDYKIKICLSLEGNRIGLLRRECNDMKNAIYDVTIPARISLEELSSTVNMSSASANDSYIDTEIFDACAGNGKKMMSNGFITFDMLKSYADCMVENYKKDRDTGVYNYGSLSTFYSNIKKYFSDEYCIHADSTYTFYDVITSNNKEE